MGKNRNNASKQGSAASSVQQLRAIVARMVSDSCNTESSTQLRQWLVKSLPSIGIAAGGSAAFKDIRESIALDLKLMEKLCCIFQDIRDCSLILLLSQLFTELLLSKRAAKLLVQCGLTLAVLCQIRMCCSVSASNMTATTTAGSSSSSWHSNAPDSATSLTSTLSMQCAIIHSTDSVEKSYTSACTSSMSTSASSSTLVTSGNNASIQCSPQVAIALHQLACRVFLLDSRYNTKARATGAILGTLTATKCLFLDRKALPVFLCVLRNYLNSAKNVKLLGQNGAISLLVRMVNSLLPRQTRLLKLSLELLSILLKSSSNCLRMVQANGVAALLSTLENICRSDIRCRQLQIRRLLLRSLLLVSQVRQGRLAILQSSAIQVLYSASRELPAKQELDGIFLSAMGVIRQCAGPRRLPINSFYSPYVFSGPSNYNTEQQQTTSEKPLRKSQSVSVSLSRMHNEKEQVDTGAPMSAGSKRIQQVDSEYVSSNDEDEAVDYPEESDFVLNSFVRDNICATSKDGSEIEGGMATGGETGADDSDSDCGAADNGGGNSQDELALMAPVPLESDPVVLASYDMFFPEIRDLSLTNTAVTVSLSMSNSDSSSTMADNAIAAAIAVGNNSNTEEAAASLRPALSNASSGSSNNVSTCTSPQRKQKNVGSRRSATNKIMLTRRSSEVVESSASAAIASNLAIEGSNKILPSSMEGSSNSGPEKATGPSTSIGGFTANRDATRYLRLAAGIKRVVIWNKVPYPCLHGWLPNTTMEPQLSMPSINIRRIVLADCDRFLQKGSASDIIGEVAYDLDAIVAAKQTSKKSQPDHLGNDDLQRIGRPCLKNSGLLFNSLFECGNLRRAIRVREYEYDLILTPDVSTDHHLQWFYFEVYNTPANSASIRFNILNCEKPKSQFEKGMQVLVFSVTEAALGRPHWKRMGTDICYYKNYLQHPSGPLPNISYYTMSFTISFEHSYDVCYLAYHYPYSYTTLLYELESIQSRVLPSDVYYCCQNLCTSEMSNNVPILTITSLNSSPAGSTSSMQLPGISTSSNATSSPGTFSSSTSFAGPMYKSQQLRPYVILTSRVHPGETNSSWMMRGLISFLLGDTQSAKRARQSFVFKIVPMLNVDGVVNGNHRCSLYGDDLNRSWVRPSPIVAPSIFHTKRLLAWLRFRRRPILCYIDFHGHSRKKNVFVLGCSPSHSWRRRDFANPAVDPLTGEEDSRWRLLPVLMAATSPAFSLQDCCFLIERAKEPTGRVVMWRQVGLIATYTLEATFCGFDQGTYRGMQVTPVHLQEVGGDLCRCLEPLLASMGKCSTTVSRLSEQPQPPANITNQLAACSLAASSSSSRLMDSMRSMGLPGTSCESSNSSSEDSSDANSAREGNSDNEGVDQTRRPQLVASKRISYLPKKY